MSQSTPGQKALTFSRSPSDDLRHRPQPPETEHLGAEGGEIMSIIQVAMLGHLPYRAMANAIFTHPLLAEGLNTLFGMVDA